MALSSVELMLVALPRGARTMRRSAIRTIMIQGAVAGGMVGITGVAVAAAACNQGSRSPSRTAHTSVMSGLWKLHAEPNDSLAVS